MVRSLVVERGGAGPELEEFALTHGSDLLRLGLLLTGTRADAEDLVQDGLVRIAAKLQKLPVDERLAYGRRTMVNLFIDSQRRLSRFRKVRHLLVSPAMAPPDLDVDTRESVLQLIGALPRKQRAAIVLRYWAGLTESEIGDALGCSVGTVKSQISRAMATLRSRIDADERNPA